MKKLIYFIILLFVSNAYGLSQDELLKPDEAFQIAEPSYDSTGNVATSWTIAEKYYLYKKTFKFKSSNENIEVGEPNYPAPEQYRDITEGKMVDIYTKEVSINVPVKTKDGSALPAELQLEVTHQGCYKGGVCYPPKKSKFTLIQQKAAEGSVAPDTSAIDSANTPAVSASSAAVPATRLIDQMGLSKKTIPVSEAFQFDLISGDNNTVTAHFNITPGHYIYKEKIKFKLKDADGLTLGDIKLPNAVIKNDSAYGEIEVYDSNVNVEITLSGTIGEQTKLLVEYQGCSELTGICYPPVNVESLISATATPVSVAISPDSSKQIAQVSDTPKTEQDIFADTIKNSSYFVILAVFFIAGLGLALTPCVFPMIPILSGIIAGQSGYLSARRAFMLSLAYVIPMAMTYAIVGVIAGLSGTNLSIIFQTPWVIGLFAFIFVVLSLSMFGFYELQMPSSIQSRLTEISNRQEGGKFIGASIMGVLSAIIVGPCVTAPLIGALIFIADTKDAVLGGSALFALGLGMGAPLLVIGTSAGKLLPRAGAWMDTTKSIFGVMMLGLAIWMLDRVVSGEVTLLLTGILLVVSSMYAGALDNITEETTPFGRLFKGFGIIMMVFGLLMLLGAALGNTSLIKPLKGTFSSIGSPTGSMQIATVTSKFEPIKGITGLDSALAQAGKDNKIAMLDFYADWCVSCKELEHFTFQDSGVIDSLKGMKTLQADVTALNNNDKEDAALLKKFGLFGPPAILFFTPDGKELKSHRLVGYYPPEEFLAHLAKVRTAAGV